MSREMKDSGIGGIGQIPENWEICPMKTYFSFGKGLSITKSDLTDNGVSVLSYGQIHSRNNPKVSTPNFLLKKLPMEKAQKQSLTSVGDFIFADTSEDRNGCGNCNYIDKDGIYAGYHTIIARVNNCPHTKYFGYLFMTDAWRFQIRRELTEVKLYSVSQKVLKRANIVIPPETERISIVHFLDRKCTAIDTAIEKTKKSIEKLEEYKKAVITKAVTKGINPNAKMKDSGVEWIGKIPEDWKIRPMKTYFSFGKGLSITKSDLTDNGVSILSYGQIHSRNNPKASTPNFLLKKLPMEKAQKQSLTSVGDFIFADTSEDRDGCGNCNYIDKDGIYAGYHTIIARPNNFTHTKYFGYLFMTDAWRFQIRRELTEVKLYSVSQKVLKRANIVIPPENERVSIVAFLDRTCTAIDNAIEKKKKAIEKWEEYKKSLIYYAVTGKIDCRNEVI